MFIFQRPATSGRSVGRKHNIVDKDYFRAMNVEKLVEKNLSVQKGMHKQSASMNKFKSKSQLIMEEFERPQISSEKEYMIDKVVRMRGKLGRFGVDHSEILNFEFE